MLKILVVLAAILMASCQTSATAPSADSCISLDGGFRIVGRAYSVDELEKIGKTFASRNSKVPQVPFAYRNEQWNRMKSLMQPGDSLREFDNPMVGPGL